MILSNVSEYRPRQKLLNLLRFPLLIAVLVWTRFLYANRSPLQHASRKRLCRCPQLPCRFGILQRRPLGVRLWLADVAAGLRIRRTGAGPADRRAPRALRLFLCPSRHPGKARPRARARSRRRLPRHRVPGRGTEPRRHRRLFARARTGHVGLPRGEALGVAGERGAAARQRAGLCGRSRPCAVRRTAVAGGPVASRAAGSRPVRRQPRLRAGDREGDRGRRFSRYAIAPAGADAARFAPGRARGNRLRNRRLRHFRPPASTGRKTGDANGVLG